MPWSDGLQNVEYTFKVNKSWSKPPNYRYIPAGTVYDRSYKKAFSWCKYARPKHNFFFLFVFKIPIFQPRGHAAMAASEHLFIEL